MGDEKNLTQPSELKTNSKTIFNLAVNRIISINGSMELTFFLSSRNFD